MTVQSPQAPNPSQGPSTDPSNEQPQRLRDKSFLAPFWRDFGLVTLFIAGAGTIYAQRAQMNYLEKVDDDRKAEISELRQLNKDLEDKVKMVPGLEKWAACREKEADSGKRHRFYWSMTECVAYEAPIIEPTAPGKRQPLP